MADNLKVYGYCSANCKHEVLTIDQTVALIQEMAANGFQVPEGFIPSTAVNKITEQNSGEQISVFVGTQAEYDAWTGDKENTFAIITDDPIASEILTRLSSVESSNKLLDTKVFNILNGTTVVPNATNATHAILKADGTYTGFTLDANGVLKCGDIIIPQRKVVLDNKQTIGGQRDITLTDTIKVGDVLDFYISNRAICRLQVATMDGVTGYIGWTNAYGNGGTNYSSYISAEVKIINTNTIRIEQPYQHNESSGVAAATIEISKIVKVIE